MSYHKYLILVDWNRDIPFANQLLHKLTDHLDLLHKYECRNSYSRSTYVRYSLDNDDNAEDDLYQMICSGIPVCIFYGMGTRPIEYMFDMCGGLSDPNPTSDPVFKCRNRTVLILDGSSLKQCLGLFNKYHVPYDVPRGEFGNYTPASGCVAFTVGQD